MNSTMTATKSSFETSNESPFFARSRATSLSVNNSSSLSNSQIFSQQYNPRIILTSSHFDYFEEEELGAPINIYHENRGRLEEDKKARTELDTDILDNDLYCPVQRQENEKSTSRGLNIGKFTSFLPRFSFSNNYGGVMESTSNNTDTWGHYHHNDMFNTNNMFGNFNFDGINGGVACK